MATRKKNTPSVQDNSGSQNGRYRSDDNLGNNEINVEELTKAKTQFQRRALCLKLITLQRRQLFNTIMQIVCPIFGLACVSILRSAVMANADIIANISIMVPVPFIYNVPLKPLSNFEHIIFNVSDCHEWYMFKFDDDVP